MRNRHVNTRILAWLTVLALTWAAAADAPEAVVVRLTGMDGDVIVTDVGGVIVGVGRVVAGEAFELRFLEGFVGPARLTLLRKDGATEALDVVVNGHVLVEGFDLLELLGDRVEAFTVEVGGVTYRAAERRGAERGASEAEGSRPVEPPGNARSPGPPGSGGDPGSGRDPGSPGGPGASPPRDPEGRP
jgi:hypothetical protein